ncbi:hypothetical protein BDV25DRAFT_143256 [Aspergillus avenaceus]|uniref:Uncharacterized protein n=1 Tax=Aspergillus avenaceus TaxID=36643 RepID=A0A5N6TLC2_ASPAV|nr:hypothetical protein BDV25DRAFT_143256 [Aspergillus avenaceus]
MNLPDDLTRKRHHSIPFLGTLLSARTYYFSLSYGSRTYLTNMHQFKYAKKFYILDDHTEALEPSREELSGMFTHGLSVTVR